MRSSKFAVLSIISLMLYAIVKVLPKSRTFSFDP